MPDMAPGGPGMGGGDFLWAQGNRPAIAVEFAFNPSDGLGLHPSSPRGEGAIRARLYACPLPIPRAEVGFIRLRPVNIGRTRVNPSPAACAGADAPSAAGSSRLASGDPDGVEQVDGNADPAGRGHAL